MEWVMLGTNTGSFAGLPPTGQKIALEGIDIFSIQDDRIESVKGYFHKAMFSQQLGLNVVLQPRALGPFTFGTAVKSSSKNPNKPGFFTMTWIELKVEDDLNAFQQESLRVIQEVQEMEGFLAFTSATIGKRLITFSMWDILEHAKQFNTSKTHRESMRKFFQPNGYGETVFTSSWVPHKINPMWVRCTACNKVVDNEDKCSCGQPLSNLSAYF
jgi:hypothetical protein